MSSNQLDVIKSEKRTYLLSFTTYESCELKISCTLLNEREVKNPLFNFWLSHSSHCFSFCYLESSCFSLSHYNFLIFLSISHQMKWHLLLEILAILSMILRNLIAITQTSTKHMLAYSLSLKNITQDLYLTISLILCEQFS